MWARKKDSILLLKGQPNILFPGGIPIKGGHDTYLCKDRISKASLLDYPCPLLPSILAVKNIRYLICVEGYLLEKRQNNMYPMYVLKRGQKTVEYQGVS